MDVLEQVLGEICGGRVLDAATGQGHFIGLLAKHLQDFDEIIGIDVNPKCLKAARAAFAENADNDIDLERVHLTQMNAESLGFEDESFDTVTLSVSLHHLQDVPKILRELKRVLKTGGRLFIGEMYRDGQTEAQRSIVHIHHWAAEIDTARGITHNKTFTRQQVLGFIKSLDLHDLALHDNVDLDQDPMDEAAIERSVDVIGKVIQRAEGLPDYASFKSRGEALMQRVREVGLQTPSILIAVGTK